MIIAAIYLLAFALVVGTDANVKSKATTTPKPQDSKCNSNNLNEIGIASK